MSLSPLFSNYTSDLHVNNDQGLQTHIMHRQPIQEKITNYRVLKIWFFCKDTVPKKIQISFHFHFGKWFYSFYLTISKLLDPCFKTRRKNESKPRRNGPLFAIFNPQGFQRNNEALASIPVRQLHQTKVGKTITQTPQRIRFLHL